jgi:WH1 domain
VFSCAFNSSPNSEMSANSENRNSTKLSKASTYLSGEENELVFRLIGRRCQSQCTTVAQLYQTESPTHNRWIKKNTGALCFVKDNAKRSYYARMFCLMRHEMVWEQEMYDTIDITRVKPYFLTFEGQVILHAHIHNNCVIHSNLYYFFTGWHGCIKLCI